MYVYRKTAVNLDRPYEVGYFVPAGADDAGTFKVSSRHDTPQKARRRVNYLNGGSVPANLESSDSNE